MNLQLKKLNKSHQIIALSLIKGFGDGMIRAIIQGDDICYDMLPEKYLKYISNFTISRLEDLKQDCLKHDVKIITVFDKHYPFNLRNVHDYPPLLYVKGDPSVLNEPGVSIVGTRRITGYGKMAVEKMVGGLIDRGLIIISGMAFGVDAYAQNLAIDCGGKSIAVLASGVESPSPRSNIRLYNKILSSGGAIVSEQKIGTRPVAGLFPLRNRIVSGMSLGTVVIEAGEKSGTSITAKQAFEQNREVFAVPGDINKLYSFGTNRLIRDGIAKLVTDPADVLVELGFILNENTNNGGSNFSFDNDLERVIFTKLIAEPISLNLLVKEVNGSVAEISQVLTEMELKGMVTTVDSKYHVSI